MTFPDISAITTVIFIRVTIIADTGSIPCRLRTVRMGATRVCQLKLVTWCREFADGRVIFTIGGRLRGVVCFRIHTAIQIAFTGKGSTA